MKITDIVHIADCALTVTIFNQILLQPSFKTITLFHNDELELSWAVVVNFRDELADGNGIWVVFDGQFSLKQSLKINSNKQSPLPYQKLLLTTIPTFSESKVSIDRALKTSSIHLGSVWNPIQMNKMSPLSTAYTSLPWKN